MCYILSIQITTKKRTRNTKLHSAFACSLVKRQNSKANNKLTNSCFTISLQITKKGPKAQKFAQHLLIYLYSDKVLKSKKQKIKNKNKNEDEETNSARSPSWRKTPTRPAIATPSSRASGSSLSAALYSSGSAKLYSFLIWYLFNGIFYQIETLIPLIQHLNLHIHYIFHI